MDLALELDPARGRRADVEEALRRAVVSGRLPVGSRLPSSRALAIELGCARATVVGAYEQLVAEGYLSARHGSGTTVADVHAPEPVGVTADPAPRRVFTELLPGEPDTGSFPRAAWLASVRQVLHTAPDETFGYGDHRGSYPLRVALASYLARSRAVIADPARIVVCNGYTSALALLAETFEQMGVRRVAMEDPCLPLHARAVASAGPEVVPVSVDADGLRVQDLDDEDAVVCTPVHQYPMGVALSPARRAALVAWGRERDAWVVEDDYDGEFRYDRHPVGALQGLSPDRVVYAGTASKSLAPGLGLAWLVLPPALVEPMIATKRLRRPALSAIEQAALAAFITSGRLDRHVRQMRTVYRRRRDAVLRVLAPRFEVIGVSAGLHVTALTHREPEIVERAAAGGTALFGIGHHVIGEQTQSGLVIGYSRSAAHAFPAAVDRLAAIVEDA